MAISNVFGSALGNSSNIANLGQLNANVGGVNLPIMPVISNRDYFLSILNTWIGSIPTNNQFVVIFESFPTAVVSNWGIGSLVSGATNTINRLGSALGVADVNLTQFQKLEPIDNDTEAWANESANSILTSYPFQRIVGCVFAQEFNIPGLDMAYAENIGVANNGGLLPGVVINHRQGYANTNLTLGFLETNTSFVDLVIRPWTVMVSHYGLTARPPELQHENIKTNVIVIEYTRSKSDTSQIPRKVWTFIDCAPLDVGSRQNTMKQSNDVKTYQTRWVFRKYNVKHNMYTSIEDVYKEITSANYLAI